jgi:hypothetical protein
MLVGLAVLVLSSLLWALDNATGYLSCGISWNATKNGPNSGINFPPTSNANSLNQKVSFVTGGNVPGGINEVATNILIITAGGSATINLQALTDVINQSAVVLVRLKGFAFQLLGTAEDSVNGTACSGVTIGNAPTNGNMLELGAVTHTRKLQNGDWNAHASRQAAGLVVSATALNVLITNNDSVNPAAVLYALYGATV